MQTDPKQPHINSYRFGCIEIDGCEYTSDVVILHESVKSPWWRDKGHALGPKDLSAVLTDRPEILVIGQGAQGMMKMTDEALTHLRDAGIEAVCVPTARAVELYNECCRRGQRVVAALHLTC